jgi:hypothetical protein
MPAPAQGDRCAQSGDPSPDDDHAHAEMIWRHAIQRN